jgi:hypothetical protein
MDFTSPKILVPAILFALLSPGMLLSLPSTKIASGQTSLQSVAIHALVLGLVYWGIVKAGLFKTTLTQADLIVPIVLFILLSPGVLLSLPSLKFASGTTSVPAVAIHTFVFVLLFAILRSRFPQYY